ncbi:hypothetical protein CYMTET_8661 [Cymbomonas tetramitiformis]|uniref:Uncharacterized protein n=1 Tax=Cymbomonas tetramitiformis TaxID=36881 RepID=A0AAE0LFV8_9CHLO|nr:hypothetical protein CYMTET_8661 [Cymbomonas tetramitiformis]
MCRDVAQKVDDGDESGPDGKKAAAASLSCGWALFLGVPTVYVYAVATRLPLGLLALCAQQSLHLSAMESVGAVACYSFGRAISASTLTTQLKLPFIFSCAGSTVVSFAILATLPLMVDMDSMGEVKSDGAPATNISVVYLFAAFISGLAETVTVIDNFLKFETSKMPISKQGVVFRCTLASTGLGSATAFFAGSYTYEIAGLLGLCIFGIFFGSLHVLCLSIYVHYNWCIFEADQLLQCCNNGASRISEKGETETSVIQRDNERAQASPNDQEDSEKIQLPDSMAATVKNFVTYFDLLTLVFPRDDNSGINYLSTDVILPDNLHKQLKIMEFAAPWLLATGAFMITCHITIFPVFFVDIWETPPSTAGKILAFGELGGAALILITAALNQLFQERKPLLFMVWEQPVLIMNATITSVVFCALLGFVQTSVIAMADAEREGKTAQRLS